MKVFILHRDRHQQWVLHRDRHQQWVSVSVSGCAGINVDEPIESATVVVVAVGLNWNKVMVVTLVVAAAVTVMLDIVVDSGFFALNDAVTSG